MSSAHDGSLLCKEIKKENSGCLHLCMPLLADAAVKL